MAAAMDHSREQLEQGYILGRLGFHGLDDRQASIASAAASTFAWLFDASATETSSSSEASQGKEFEQRTEMRKLFVDWLRQGDGFFYISGKPGAGKSTLLKFISSHPAFREHLQSWSSGTAVVTGKFFFWLPGSDEQKSMAGLIRGLLYSVIEALPLLAAVAFPELCERFANGQKAASVITQAQAEKAFGNVLDYMSQEDSKLKMLLMLDGLDEFDGDHAYLLEIMNSWISRSGNNIKLCASSRAYPVFESFFASSPKMRLHELTRADMRAVIRSRLQNNRFFSSLSTEETAQVQDQISERAEGVFLWAVMVIAKVTQEIAARNVTNFSELERTIRLCPSELDNLFPHLLESVRESERPWAYRAILMIRFAQVQFSEKIRSNHSSPGVGLLDFMLLDESSRNWSMSTFQPRSERQKDDVPVRLDRFRTKVLDKCMAFLSVVTLSSVQTWPAGGKDKLFVSLTHRAVVEFLASDHAKNKMGPYLSTFDPFIPLMSTMLGCLRFLQPSEYPFIRTDVAQRENMALLDVLEPSLVQRLKSFTEYAVETEAAGSPRFLSLLDAIGDAIKRNLVIGLSTKGLRLSPVAALPHQALCLITLSRGAHEYLDWRAQQGFPLNADPHWRRHNALAFAELIQTCEVFRHNPDSKTREMTVSDSSVAGTRWNKLLDRFLEIDMNLHESLSGCSWKYWQTIDGIAWSCWQSLIWAMLIGNISSVEKFPEMLDRCLKKGADPDLAVLTIVNSAALRIPNMDPEDGWKVFVPFAISGGLSLSLVQDKANSLGQGPHRSGQAPILLVQDSASLGKYAASGQETTITLSQLIGKWLPDANNLEVLTAEISLSEEAQQHGSAGQGGKVSTYESLLGPDAVVTSLSSILDAEISA